MMTLHPSGRGRFELRDDIRVIGRLDRVSSWHSRYRASSADGSWLIHRRGLFHPDLVISDWYSDQVVSVYTQTGRDAGTLLLNGCAYRFRIDAAEKQFVSPGSLSTWRLGLRGAGANMAGIRPGPQQLVLLVASLILIEHFDRAPLAIEITPSGIAPCDSGQRWSDVP